MALLMWAAALLSMRSCSQPSCSMTTFWSALGRSAPMFGSSFSLIVMAAVACRVKTVQPPACLPTGPGAPKSGLA